MTSRSFFSTTILLIASLYCQAVCAAGKSAVGDPGMRRDGLRVAFEAWNFCNEVGEEAPGMGSPRAADCFDFKNSSLIHKVSEADNRLGLGTPFPGLSPNAAKDADLYAAEKEIYLGSLCQVSDGPKPWQFWMIMLKNGNYDTESGLCPENGRKAPPFKPGRFPCFGSGCMNQPVLYHQPTRLYEGGIMRGGFNGSYDLDAKSEGESSYFEVVWEKKGGSGGWVFDHKLKTSKKYPWLMLYLRADATRGFSGGYHYDTRGMLKKVRKGLDSLQFEKFIFICWNIWSHRNRKLHGADEGDPFVDMQVLNRFIRDFRRARTPTRLTPSSQWQPPHQGFIKINFDAAFSSFSGVGSAAVVAPDSEGSILFWRVRRRAHCGSAENAEAFAAWHAIQLAVERNWTAVIIEGDCANVIQGFKSVNPPLSDAGQFFEAGRQLIQLFHSLEFRHIHREGNTLAHQLAGACNFDCEGVTLPFSL